MKIFYHNDLDGRAAAFIAQKYAKYCQDMYTGEEQIDFTELDYKKPLPIDTIQKDETVIIVDYSFSESTLPVLLEIMDKTEALVWIDHHKTSIDLIEKHPELRDRFRGVINNTASGALLTYDYFYKDDMGPTPHWIELVSDYDTWTYRYGDRTTHFKIAMDCVPHQPFDKIWERLDDSFKDILVLTEMIEKGKSIKEYIDIQNKEHFERYAFESEFEGHKCLVINRATNSWIFGDKIKEYPFVATVVYDGTGYSYSLYSDNKDMDCSEIAKKYGGGGHKGAAGFYSDKLLLSKIK